MTGKIPEALAVLDALEWAGFRGARCPFCLGWDGGPSGMGETDHRHTKACGLVKARAAFAELYESSKSVNSSFAVPDCECDSCQILNRINKALAAVEKLP